MRNRQHSTQSEAEKILTIHLMSTLREQENAVRATSPRMSGVLHANAMPTSTEQPRAQISRDAARVSPLRGQIVYFYAFDVAYEMLRTRITTLLGQPVADFIVDSSK